MTLKEAIESNGKFRASTWKDNHYAYVDGGVIMLYDGQRTRVLTIEPEQVTRIDWEVVQDTIEVGDVVVCDTCPDHRSVRIKKENLTLIRKGPKRYEYDNIEISDALDKHYGKKVKLIVEEID